MSNNKRLPDNQIIVYQTSDGKINIEVLYTNENIWLSQKRMGELFDCTADNISLHLKNIYNERELEEGATTEVFSVVKREGFQEVTRKVILVRANFARTANNISGEVLSIETSTPFNFGEIIYYTFPGSLFLTTSLTPLAILTASTASSIPMGTQSPGYRASIEYRFSG